MVAIDQGERITTLEDVVRHEVIGEVARNERLALAEEIGHKALTLEQEFYLGLAMRLSRARTGDQVLFAFTSGSPDQRRTVMSLGVMETSGLYYNGGYSLPTSHFASTAITHKEVGGSASFTGQLPRQFGGIGLFGYSYRTAVEHSNNVRATVRLGNREIRKWQRESDDPTSDIRRWAVHTLRSPL